VAGNAARERECKGSPIQAVLADVRVTLGLRADCLVSHHLSDAPSKVMLIYVPNILLSSTIGSVNCLSLWALSLSM
jgi:hypothetical protein